MDEVKTAKAAELMTNIAKQYAEDKLKKVDLKSEKKKMLADLTGTGTQRKPAVRKRPASATATAKATAKRPAAAAAPEPEETDENEEDEEGEEEEEQEEEEATEDPSRAAPSPHTLAPCQKY